MKVVCKSEYTSGTCGEWEIELINGEVIELSRHTSDQGGGFGSEIGDIYLPYDLKEKIKGSKDVAELCKKLEKSLRYDYDGIDIDEHIEYYRDWLLEKLESNYTNEGNSFDQRLEKLSILEIQSLWRKSIGESEELDDCTLDEPISIDGVNGIELGYLLEIIPDYEDFQKEKKKAMNKIKRKVKKIEDIKEIRFLVSNESW